MRSEFTKCEVSQNCIDELIEQLKNKVGDDEWVGDAGQESLSIEIRSLMITIIRCKVRYG